MLHAFLIESLHMEWLVANIRDSLKNDALPASMKRNLRAVVKKNLGLSATLENLMNSENEAGSERENNQDLTADNEQAVGDENAPVFSLAT